MTITEPDQDKQSVMESMMESKPSLIRSNRAAIIKRHLVSAKVPPRFMTALLSDFSFDTSGLAWQSLFLTGSRGVGKTHLIAALIRQQISDQLDNTCPDGELNSAMQFASIPEVLLEIRRSFDVKEVSESDLINHYTNIGWLYLDDLGVEKPSEWVLQTLYLIIDRRYRNLKQTIISSNYNLQEISDRLDDRISSRIAGMCKVCRLSGLDRRLSK